MPTVLVAPDKFKDALDAGAVAEAIAAGLRDARPDLRVDRCPLADGGEGTGAVLAAACDLTTHRCRVLDPLARLRTARWWSDADRRYAVIEMAEASGLHCLTPRQRKAVRTTTCGTGQLIAAAIAAGCAQIDVCVGGSATVDGGAGCLQALGFELLDAEGRRIDTPAAGGMLDRICAIRPPVTRPAVRLRVLCDVDNPLLGPRGAAAVFAPQKGANAREVRRLEANLTHWARLLKRDLGRDVTRLAGAGAAGGLPAALHAALNATLVAGFDVVAEATRLRERIATAWLVITGEGRLDVQTAGGKVVAGVARLAREAGRPVVAIVGAVHPDTSETQDRIREHLGIEEVITLSQPREPLAEALRQTPRRLRAAARAAAQRWTSRDD